ncbi:transforming growth factor beta regulator 1 [Anas platyrhynchos]|uniref:transforming growth factor beta regulator 1 n=1 Tax=Anas platyrhynchos TaxID=8839 RepID=UPI003AF30EF0
MPKAPRGRPAERYRLKYNRLRRAARALVFENGALCDEVARLEAKFLRARDERRFLLTRLLQLRALAGPEEAGGEGGRRARRGGGRRDGGKGAEGRPGGGRNGGRPGGARDLGSVGARDLGSRDLGSVGSRDLGSMGSRDLGSRDLGSRDLGSRDELRSMGSRDLGSRDLGSRDDARPAASRDTLRPSGSRDAPLDDPRDPARPNGPRGAPKMASAAPAAILRPNEEASNLAGPRPRRAAAPPPLPLTLGPLTIQNLGVIGAGGATNLPPGYRSTRLFASLRRPARRCLYTCRIVAGPRCEIVAEDEPGRVFSGATPDFCHARLLQALEEAGGRPRGSPHGPGAGEEFFGLTHPVVRRHLQGEAGAFIHPEEEEEEEEDDEDDEDDEDEEEEEEEEGAAQAFPYGDIFLGSPTGSDD